MIQRLIGGGCGTVTAACLERAEIKLVNHSWWGRARSDIHRRVASLPVRDVIAIGGPEKRFLLTNGATAARG